MARTWRPSRRALEDKANAKNIVSDPRETEYEASPASSDEEGSNAALTGEASLPPDETHSSLLDQLDHFYEKHKPLPAGVIMLDMMNVGCFGPTVKPTFGPPAAATRDFIEAVRNWCYTEGCTAIPLYEL